jgi:formylglycine-generating enzyme required for sulfatase activity
MRAVLGWMLLTGCGRIGFDAAGSAGDGALVDGPPAVSCGALPSMCGPTGTSSCCESPVVPGGTFYRSYDGVGYDDMSYPATVSAFRLDTFEVTVGRFRAFLSAGFGTQQNPPAVGAGARTLNSMANQGGWDASWMSDLPGSLPEARAALKCDSTFQTWTDAPAGNEDRPINCVTWYQGMAFCIWDGGFLPTEAEWNYAAAGGAMQRAYPWSSPPNDLTIDNTRASYQTGSNCLGDGMPACAGTDILPVGIKPAGNGQWGHADLGGNIAEWVLDTYAAPYATTSCDDCANVADLSMRGIRGGAFNYSAVYARSADRFADFGAAAYINVGFRCAR